MHASDNLHIFPFALGVDSFDETTEAFYKSIMQNVMKTIDQSPEKSSFMKLYKKLSQRSLQQQLADQQICTFAQDIYASIQNDDQILTAFNAAQESTKTNAPLEQRQDLWVRFKSTANQKLAIARNQSLPAIKDHKPNSPTAIADFLEDNKDLALNPEQENRYAAFFIVMCSFKQNHRLIDPATDGANLILHKNVTAVKK
jgi:hypothetical protein